MSTILHRTAAALGFLAVVGVGSAQAQQLPDAAPAAAVSTAAQTVGRWLHDAQGNTIGSVRALADDGRSVVVMLGSYFQPGSHAATVPARSLVLVDGKVTLRSGTIEAMNTLTH